MIAVERIASVNCHEGRDVEPETRGRRLSRAFGQIGYAVSLVGLGLLAYEAFLVAQGTEPSIPTLVVYAGLFIGGRLLKLVLDSHTVTRTNRLVRDIIYQRFPEELTFFSSLVESEEPEKNELS